MGGEAEKRDWREKRAAVNGYLLEERLGSFFKGKREKGATDGMVKEVHAELMGSTKLPGRDEPNRIHGGRGL